MQEKSPNEVNFLVKKLIKQSGKKQKDIARFVGVSPVTVTRWVNGDRNISPEHMESLCKYLGVTYPVTGEQVTEANKLTGKKSEPTPEEWKERAIAAEAKLKHLREACSALGHHVSALGSTVESFSRIISE